MFAPENHGDVILTVVLLEMLHAASVVLVEAVPLKHFCSSGLEGFGQIIQGFFSLLGTNPRVYPCHMHNCRTVLPVSK